MSPGNARGEDVPCPICGLYRDRRNMERHLEARHTLEGHEQAARNGERHGKGRRDWARRLLVRRGL